MKVYIKLKNELIFQKYNILVDEMKASYADSIGAPEIPNVTWDDVGGLSELKEEILSSLLTPISSNNLYRSGIHLKKSLCINL